jgi:hypothetical protein
MSAGPTEHAAALAAEMGGAPFGDARLSKRQTKLVQKLAEAPDQSFPTVFSEAELEAAYRFFGNDDVTPKAILAPHVDATLERLASEPVTLALHDTTTLTFRPDGQRKGLGRLRKSGQSFFAHFTLAVSGDGTRRPLGVLDLSTYVRAGRKETNERARWGEQVTRVAALGSVASRVVHVMDREGDDYGLFAHLLRGAHRFVIRLAHNRLLETEAGEAGGKLEQALEGVVAKATREVELSARPAGARSPVQKRIHPVRAPVEWVLLTNEPIETAEQLLRIVDWYRARWVIEEFFKALKTGCAYEKRQIEDLHGLCNVLALFAPIAWQLLLLRSEARRTPTQPANTVLTSTQLEVLRAFARTPLPKKPTLHEALLAIAALGGHLRHNGEPGWQTLGRGYEKLTLLVHGWKAAHQQGEL